MLNYKTIMGDILVFKDKCTMTIARGNAVPWVERIEVDGEDLDIFDDGAIHPFTEQEIDYFIKNYEAIVGPKY